MTDLRKIDALVAEHVLGWRFCKSTFEQYEPSFWVDSNGKFIWSSTFTPSTDIAAAWKALETLGRGATVAETYGRGWICTNLGSDYWQDHELSAAEFKQCHPNDDDGQVYYAVQAPAAPLAICLAALRAKGVWI